MSDLIIFFKTNLAEHFVIYFIPLYYLGGRPIALISAQLLGQKIALLFPVAVLLDTLQIPLFYHVYETVSDSSFVQRLRQSSRKKEAQKQRSRIFRWIQTLGSPGVVVIAMLPLKGCGILSGFVLAKLLRLSKISVYLLLIFGSILGCCLLFGLGELILQVWGHFKGAIS